MSSLNSVLDIAKTALLSTQKAINVTSHNISNANTEGYTRQRAVLEPMQAVAYGGLFYGTGVTIQNIQRVYDNFQTIQLRSADSVLSRFQKKDELLKGLESVLNDHNGTGLNTPLESFFNSFNDVANNPSSTADRTTLLSNASILTEGFHNINNSINQNLSNINQEIVTQVNEINSIATQIAEINQQISTVEVAGISANDLRDKRDALLGNLSKTIDVSTMENKTGQMDVYIGEGFFLVTGNQTQPLEAAINDSNPQIYDIKSNGAVLNDRISGGSLKGILEGAAYYQDVQNKLDVMAASLIKNVNLQHRAGYGLDGSTDNDFFSAWSFYAKPWSANTGGAIIQSGSITDYSLLTLNDYEIRFSNSSNYNVINKATGSIVTSGAYTSGNLINFDGLSVKITDNTGIPAAGDAFAVSITKNAAQNIAVAITDAAKIAASSTAAGAPGNNQNALALADLKNTKLLNGSTFSDYYNGVVTDLGLVTSENATYMDSQKKVVEQLDQAKQSTSGVSLEEEAISLLKLQKAYEAAAKLLTTADKMMETLLNIR